MKTLNVHNSENETVIVVVNNEDFVIEPNETVVINTNASFNSDDFYVDGDDEGKWKANYSGENKENLSLHTKQYHNWSTQKSECGAYEV